MIKETNKKQEQSAHLTYKARVRFHEDRLAEMKIVAETMDEDALRKIADKIDGANSVFVAALGRSRLNIVTFAARLKQMGIRSHVVGDVSTPSIHKGDVFIIGSSSGNTSSLVAFAKKAAALGVDILLFTENEKSQIGDLAALQYVMKVDESRLAKHPGLYAEYAINLAYQCIVQYLMKKRGVSKEQMQGEACNLYE